MSATDLIRAPARPADPMIPERGRRGSWPWLLLGALLLPFTIFQTVMPVAAWLAPIFLLRFARTQRARVGLPVIALVGYLATLISLRGFFLRPPEVFLFALGGALIALPYAADRMAAGRLPGWREPWCSPRSTRPWRSWSRSIRAVCSEAGAPPPTEAAIHDDMAIVRAIENGVSILRPTRLGTSLATDPLGRVLASSDYFVGDDQTMLATVPTEGVPTAYSLPGTSWRGRRWPRSPSVPVCSGCRLYAG